MPNESVASIVIKAQDGYSTVLTEMSKVTASLDKKTESLNRTLKELSGEKTVLQAKTNQARKAMKEAQEQFAKTGDAADGLAASLKGQEFEDWNRKLMAVNKTMKETEKRIQSVEGVEKRSSGTGKAGVDSLINALAVSGAGDMVSQLFQEGVGTVVGSLYGGEGAAIVSNTVSSALSGASIGTMIAPGIGTAIGAV